MGYTRRANISQIYGENIKAQIALKNLNFTNIFWITVAHILALSAILFFWSTSGFIVCMIGLFVAAPLGINLGYHRLLSHRALVVPKWLKYILVSIGAVIGGGPPLLWVASHRLHHRYTDTDGDPYNAGNGFWYSHILHLFLANDFETNEKHWKRYVPDLIEDPVLMFLGKYWLWMAVATLPILYAIGGLNFMLWASFVRVVLTWHIMWFVNSASHMWGYRSYETADNTRNCWWVGILAAGEGWHNNHHANPSAAAHGQRWWEFDLTYMFILILEFFGLASEVKRPQKQITEPAAD